MCANEPQIKWIDQNVKYLELELPLLAVDEDRPESDAELVLGEIDKKLVAIATELALPEPETWTADELLDELLKRLGGSFAMAYALKRQIKIHSTTLASECSCKWCIEARQALAQFGFPV